MALPGAEIAAEVAEWGYSVLDPGLPQEGVETLLRGLGRRVEGGPPWRSGGTRDALRLLPEANRIVRHPLIAEVACSVIGPGAFAVRGIVFDKTSDSNWRVPWHQDLTIAVRGRTTTDGYGPWSTKAGIPHVQPPDEILEKMIAIRIHLDDCDPTNGPLRVLAGSHKGGRLSSRQVREAPGRYREVVCALRRGGLVVMRPLLLHASSPAKAARHRRVLHLEFASGPLAPGLEWSERWPCRA
jgi:ectoine hydroxylase-related dioxygenase (phytanoyl-CoA dioxygenase family)